MFTKIGRILRLFWNQIGFHKRREQERLEQRRDGYQIFLIHALTAIFILYRESDKTLILDAKFTSDNNAVLSVRALEYWFEPRGEKLSELEYETAKSRMIKFYSAWGNVTLDDSPVRTVKEIISDLNSRGIDFHKLEET